MNKRSFLKVVGAGVGICLALEGGIRFAFESKKSRILAGSEFVEEIEGIKVFVDQEEISNILLQVILNNLRKILSFLPKTLTNKVEFIRLKFVSNENYFASGVAYSEMNGIEMFFKKIDRSEKDQETSFIVELTMTLIHEIIHLITRKKSNLSTIELIQAVNCRHSLNECVNSYSNLINESDLTEWLDISTQNGGYISNTILDKAEYFDQSKFLRENFGYAGFGHTKLRYGVLNLLEDIACVFEQVIYRLYIIYQQREYTDAEVKLEINKLLAETPGETGLWKKYQIACKSLNNLFMNEMSQETDPVKKKQVGKIN